MPKDREYELAKATLDSWSFLKDYERKRDDFIAAAQIPIYTLHLQGTDINPEDGRQYVDLVTQIYRMSPVWNEAAEAKPFLKPVDYKVGVSRFLCMRMVESG